VVLEQENAVFKSLVVRPMADVVEDVILASAKRVLQGAQRRLLEPRDLHCAMLGQRLEGSFEIRALVLHVELDGVSRAADHGQDPQRQLYGQRLATAR